MATTGFDEAGSGPLARAGAALDDLFATGLDPTDAEDARALIGAVERLARRVRAAQVEVLEQVDRRGRHRTDGHASAKVAVRHHAKTSDAEALRRARSARMVRDLPTVRQAWRAGTVGSCQVDRIARAHANPRARAWFVAYEDRVLSTAQTMSYRLFDLQMTDWERLADQDGTCDTNQRRHDDRDASITQDRGAAAHANAPGGSMIVTNIVIDHATFERELHRLFGDPSATPAPVPAAEVDRFRCSTLDGHPTDPTETVATALLGHVRRVVIGSDSVVIDFGRRCRLFTGTAQLAVKITSTECYWPGCHVPVSQCQIDHLEPWAPPHHGSTSPGNGGPACGRHNRFKQQHGFTARRDAAGEWHTYRADGTEIT